MVFLKVLEGFSIDALYQVANEAMVAETAMSWRKPDRYRVSGIKIAIDGSIDVQ